MFSLRTLSFNDVLRAVQRGEVALAFRISQNLCSNAVNSVQFSLRKRPRLPVRRVTRRPS